MALSYKLLWVSPLGVDGKSAFVVIKEDTPPAEYRIFEVMGVPARYTPSMILAWLPEHFTLQQAWLDARTLTGHELEMWLLLWQESEAIAAIDAEIDLATLGIAAAQQDIVTVNASTLPAAAKTAFAHIFNREVGLLTAEIAQRRREKTIIQTVIKIIRSRAPFTTEAPGANGGS